MLSTLDPTRWGLSLSPENARQCWYEATHSLEAELSLPTLSLPSRVLMVASANVFTATLPWMHIFSRLGVSLRVKAARTLGPALTEIAACFPGVEVVDVRRSEPLDALVAGCAAGIVFGTTGAIEAFANLGLPTLGFGPRYGAVYTEDLPRDARAIAEDLARYDSRGCMSPAVCFVQAGALTEAGLGAIAKALSAAQEKWPRGLIYAEEGHGLRVRSVLARAAGRLWEGEGWQLVVLPPRFFKGEVLPRGLLVCPVKSQEEALSWMAGVPELGTFATRQPVVLPRVRVCVPGELQRPPLSTTHDGVEVLSWLSGHLEGR